MKLDPHLPQLPSIGELLEHPRVKGVVARINRSTLAQRATGFLEELRSSLATRPGGEAPTLAHLAERLARQLLGEPVVPGSVINATGVVLGEPELGAPLAERSLHAIFQLASEYHRDDGQPLQSLQREIADLVGGEASCVMQSFESALTLTLAATATGREAFVCGGAAPETNGEIDWPRLAALSGVVVRGGELSAVASSSAIIRPPDAEAEFPLPALAAAATQHSAVLIDAAPIAGAIDPAPYGFQSIETIAQRLAAGADLVVVDAAGLLGGPSCGMIIGRRRLVDAVANHPLASLAAVDRLTAAALSTIIQAYRADAASQVIFQAPVWQLLSAPLDNLRQRAERLAPQMAESAAIATAEARQVDSIWRRRRKREWLASSWAVLITPKDGDSSRLRTELGRAPYPILARVADDAVAIDLRSTFPRWDQQLVAAVEAVAG